MNPGFNEIPSQTFSTESNILSGLRNPLSKIQFDMISL